MERIWYLVSDGDTDLVSTLMRQFEQSHSLPLPPTLLSQVRQAISKSCVVPDENIRQCLLEVWKRDSYLLCPHSATGVFFHNNHSLLPPEKCVVLATASVMKFEKTVVESGVEFPGFEEVANLMKLEARCSRMVKGENWEQMLRTRIEKITENVLKRKK